MRYNYTHAHMLLSMGNVFLFVLAPMAVWKKKRCFSQSVSNMMGACWTTDHGSLICVGLPCEVSTEKVGGG